MPQRRRCSSEPRYEAGKIGEEFGGSPQGAAVSNGQRKPNASGATQIKRWTFRAGRSAVGNGRSLEETSAGDAWNWLTEENKTGRWNHRPVRKTVPFLAPAPEGENAEATEDHRREAARLGNDDGGRLDLSL